MGERARFRLMKSPKLPENMQFDTLEALAGRSMSMSSVSTLSRILVFGGKGAQAAELAEQLRGRYQPVVAETVEGALELLRQSDIQGVCLFGDDLAHRSAIALLLQAGGILSQIPEGLAILDTELNILWSNPKFQELTAATNSLAGQSFYEAFGTPEILGTFNVESTKTGAFSENDLQFLEVFSREVAVALNTLELLVAEKMSAATESIDLILREVAKPVDEVLNDATWVLERYIGHEPHVCERLQRILKHTRDIKQLIHKVGETITPKSSHSSVSARPQRPKLRHKRVLVADEDETVRRAAHELLGRFGCEVETAHNGEEALLMVRRADYDAVLADIRLPDMTGYECFCQLREIQEQIPVILMTGFGYDPGHSIVKARQQGLKAVLYKPFRLDQLLEEVEKAVCQPRAATLKGEE